MRRETLELMKIPNPSIMRWPGGKFERKSLPNA